MYVLGWFSGAIVKSRVLQSVHNLPGTSMSVSFREQNRKVWDLDNTGVLCDLRLTTVYSFYSINIY